MKKRLTRATIVLCCLTIFNPTFAQNATLSNPSACGLGLPITDNNCPDGGVFYQPDQFAINVSGAPGTVLGTNVYLKEIRLIIQHPWAGDLDISLKSPSGKTAKLSFDNGGGDDNYGSAAFGCGEYMTLSVAACQSITQGQAPFLDGIYQPEESFFLFNDGMTNPNGQWILQICDDAEDDAGTLEYVHLVFESTSCLPITNVSVLNVDTTTVRLNWAPDDCTPVIVEYGPPGFIPGTDENPGEGMLAFANSCAPYNLQGLQPDTEYEIYIRRRCVISSTFSENSCPITVQTGCLPPPQTIVEPFSGYANCTPGCGVACDFPGIWRNTNNGDGFDWIVYQGSTPTIGTGPSNDVNGGTSKYVYLEASGSACNNGRFAYLLSNCIRIDKRGADDCHMSFNYHMWGANIGALRLQASIDGGANWITMWEKSGDQGNQWHKVYLSLNQFADAAIVRFRFVGVGGNGSKGDIALDHIVFFGSENLGVPDAPFYADADGDGYGNSNVFILSCLNEIPPGYTLQGGDCNDNDPNVNPTAPEIPCDGIDNNCNGNADENLLPPPVVTNDTICSGEVAVICATPSAGRPIFWYTSPDGSDIVGAGTCFFPNLPLNNSPVPVVHKFYAQETDFVCGSASRAEAIVIVNPNPDVSHTTTPEVCPGEPFDLESLQIEDANFTGASITFHSTSPAKDTNLMPSTMVNPTQTTTYFYLATTPEGCTDEQSVSVFAKLAPNLAFAPAKAFSLCVDNTEQVIVNASGGGGNYTYLWSTGEADTDILVNSGNSANAINSYGVTVTGGNGCTTTDSVTVTTTNSIDSVRVATQGVTSCSSNTGSITVTPLAGQSPFSYAWSSANGVSGSIEGIIGAYTISNLPQGAYRITITDNSTEACEFFLRNVFVDGPAATVRRTDVRDVTCASASDGSITLNVTGVTPQYLWSTGATTSAIQNLPGGIYSVTITDGQCETVLEDIVVKEPEALKIVSNLTSPTCATSNNGVIDINVFGGTKSYNFLWNNGSRREDLEDLTAGTYSLTLTDAKNCELIEMIQLQAPAPLAIAIDSSRNVSCFGGEDGFLKVQANGGTPPYRYHWNTGSVSPVLPNLSTGNYTVTVTDFNDCQQVRSFNIAQPALLQLGIANQVNPQCIGDNTGLLEAGATGGTAPYTFEWNTGAIGSTINSLEVGEYVVTLTDANGCIGGELTVDLIAASPINVAVTVNSPECIGRTDGRINLQPTGSAPFTYNWNRGDISQSLNDVGVGTYTVTVEDNQGCLFDTTITVNAVQVFDLSISPFQPSCFQSTDGAIEVNFFSAGTPPVNYTWSNGAITQDLMGLTDGAYVLSLTDSRGCTFVSDTIEIVNPEPLMLNIETLGQITCAGDSTGFIEVEVQGGVAPYDFDWVGTGETTEDIFNLSAGEYRLVVLDANQCPIDTTFKLNEPAPLITEIEIEVSDECDEQFSNEIRAVTKGGVAPYQYFWSNGARDSILTNVLPGEYQVLVEDANACTELIPSIKVREAGVALTIDTFFVKNVTCFGANDGEMTVRVAGGTAPFRFHFSNSAIYNSSEREITVKGLPPNSGYNVTITDIGSSCVVVSPKEKIDGSLPLSYLFERVNDPNCFSSADGAIFALTSGGTGPYTYQWYNQNGTLVGTNEDLRSIPNGTYTGIVTDAYGCQDTILEQELFNNNEIIRFASPPVVQDVNCFGERSGSINITLQGGAPPFDFRWSNNRTTEDISGLAPGAYTLTVTDSDTCRVIFPPVVVDGPDSDISITGKVSDVLCFGDTSGSIEVLVTGGKRPYDFVWEFRGNVFVEDTSNLTGLRAGVYTLAVRDSNMCVKTTMFEVKEPPKLAVDIGFGTGNIASAIVTGGMPGYRYLWNTGENTREITIPDNGDYSLTVTDMNNCEATTDSFLVSDEEALLSNAVKVFPNPGTGIFWMEIDLPVAAELQLEIWNALGQRVEIQNLGFLQKTQSSLDLRQQPSGLYWLNLYANGQTVYTGKLFLQKE